MSAIRKDSGNLFFISLIVVDIMPVFEKLSEPTAEMIEKANELRAVEETRRLAHRVQSVSQS